ncbi:hypothetical protein C5B96_15025 [Subtercola sp. Z020]|uniref:sensor histidine kinase n=1 Tax=Subtercola sp. Z020 TaxID=2080582 RepID=UPI000CE85932|nr:HAMP domain-containing sensor histidine kinase [Subtercola sp. Z020]PPF77856.1 hypothetical protein C5B96_15025 [Subtercola sp. Z020]
MRWPRRLSIRVRLTAGTLIIAAVFFAGTAVVVHRQVESILRSSSVMLLQGDAAQYQQEISDGRTSNLDTPAQGQLVAVIDPAGKVMQSSLPGELEPQLPTLAAGGTAVQDVRTPAAQYLVLARPVTTNEGVWQVVTARNEAASKLSLDNLTRALLWGLVILTLLFGVGSWLLASAALRPVTAMRRTAERLRGSSSVELLPVGPAHDELYYLATTLNELIGQLRASADREKQLVSDASHELRTPLAILQTQLELAHLSTGDPAALLGEIESAERTVQRLSALAASLLELTRIEGMTSHEATGYAELADELVDAIDRARLLSSDSDVVVDYEIVDAGLLPGVAALSGVAVVPGAAGMPGVAASPGTPAMSGASAMSGAAATSGAAAVSGGVAESTGSTLPVASPPRTTPSGDPAPQSIVEPPGDAAPAVASVRDEAYDLSRRSFGRVIDNLLGNAVVAVSSVPAPGRRGEADSLGVGGRERDASIERDAAGTAAVVRDATLARDAAGTVRATLRRGPDAVTLEITDTGPGMSPDFIPLAFDRFAREDESRGGSRPGSRGAGLGLSIVQALVSSAGGTVTMTNRRPRGLSVVVTIPSSTGTPAAAGSPPATVSHPANHSRPAPPPAASSQDNTA